MVQSVERFTVAFWTKSSERALLFAHPRLTYALRRLDILSQIEDSLWFRFSAFFRADPCLRLLEELEENLKRRVERTTVRGFALKSEEYLIHTCRMSGL
jgi:hypothetical protein